MAHLLSKFQSTLRASRETVTALLTSMPTVNFNPLSAQAERPEQLKVLTIHLHFNPLSAQAERRIQRRYAAVTSRFQSTLRASRETVAVRKIGIDTGISIHSPRKQRDSKYAQPLQSSHATILCILNKLYNPNNNYHTITNHPQPFFQAFQVRRIQ